MARQSLPKISDTSRDMNKQTTTQNDHFENNFDKEETGKSGTN